MNLVGAAERKHLHVTGPGPASSYENEAEITGLTQLSPSFYHDALNIIKMLPTKRKQK